MTPEERAKDLIDRLAGQDWMKRVASHPQDPKYLFLPDVADAFRYAIREEREACAKLAADMHHPREPSRHETMRSTLIRVRDSAAPVRLTPEQSRLVAIRDILWVYEDSGGSDYREMAAKTLAALGVTPEQLAAAEKLNQ